MLYKTQNINNRNINQGTEKPGASACTWGGLKWEAKDVWSVSELRDGGTLGTSVLTRDTSTCGGLCSVTFNFSLCAFSSVSTEKINKKCMSWVTMSLHHRHWLNNPAAEGRDSSGQQATVVIFSVIREQIIQWDKEEPPEQWCPSYMIKDCLCRQQNGYSLFHSCFGSSPHRRWGVWAVVVWSFLFFPGGQTL